jgi:transposase
MLLTMMLDNIDRLTAQVTVLEGHIEELVTPFCRQVEQLTTIPCVGRFTAAELIAELGVDMTRFATAGHLVSWAKFCPTTHESAGKTKPKGRTRATRGWAPPSVTRSGP